MYLCYHSTVAPTEGFRYEKVLIIIRNIVIITIAMTILIASIRKINDIRYRPKGTTQASVQCKGPFAIRNRIDGVQAVASSAIT